MTSFAVTASEAWENDGMRLSPLLDGIFAVVVAGTDAAAAASVAIGIARVQGETRRVAVADLVGESPALETLLTGDDPHGIADSFLYGVSLNKIARPMRDVRNVFLMPSGTEAVAHEAVYANDRWRRLAAGFQQVGALLVVVAVPGTPGFAELCAYIGALLPVGDTAFPAPPGVPILAPPPPPAAAPPPPPQRDSAARARAAAADNAESRNRKLIVLLVALGGVAVAIGALLPQIRDRLPAPILALITGRSRDTARIVVPASFDSVRLNARRDSITADSLLHAVPDSTRTISADSVKAAAPPITPPLAVANPADSAIASRYAVYFATANTLIAALPDARVRALPAVAISPVSDSGEQWFRVTVGAMSTRAGADALLARMRADRLVGSGSIVAVPFAIRLDSGVVMSTVRARAAAYTKRGITAYALQQVNGSATMYTGAFESPQQATSLADSLKVIGIAPVLVYRTGRAF